ncbi:MAG: site-specific integrase [Candidatus Hydrogenedens sp.]|nr:site-specific integrase [Candidatus Hydrogenedens sp.]
MRTALYSKVVNSLQRFPKFKGREISSNDILLIYLEIFRMKSYTGMEFDRRFKQTFGIGGSGISSEYASLGELFDVLSLADLFRFVCTDLLGDPRGALEILKDKSLEETVLCISRAGEEKWDLTYQYGLFDVPLVNDGILSPEAFSALQRSVQNIVIRNEDFTEKNTVETIIDELTDIYNVERYRTELMLRTYRASSARFKPREVTNELFVKIRDIEPLDYLESVYATTEYNQIKLETGLVYELISGSVDISDSTEHVVLIDPSLYFVRRWLSDASLNAVATSFVFSSRTVCDFVKVSNLRRDRVGLTNVVTIHEWEGYLSYRTWGRLKLATKLYANLKTVSETDRTIQQFVYKYKTGLKSQANLFLFCSMDENDRQTIEQGINPTVEGFHLAAYGLIEEKSKESSSWRFILSYMIGMNPVYEHIPPQQPIVYSPSHFGDDILIRSNLIQPSILESRLALTPPSTGRTPVTISDVAHSTTKGPEEIVFSPELVFRMRKVFDGQTLTRISVYCRGLPEIRTRKYLGTKTGREIPGTLINRVFSDIESAREWACMEYPFENTPKYLEDKGKDFPKSVREAISRRYAESLRNSDSTLRGFYYTHENLETGLSGRKKALLRDIMLSDVGLIRISDCDVERLSDALVANAEDLSSEEVNERLGLIHVVLTYAVEMKCTEMNMLSTWAGEVHKVINRRKQARAALGKNSLRLSSLKRYLTELRSNIAQPAYLGLMIQLFTGLSASEVCALSLDSFEHSPLLFGMLIKITQEMTEAGVILSFDESKKYRWIPCVSYLKPYLSRRIEYVLNVSKSGLKPENLLLLTDYSRVNEGDGGILKPKTLRKLSKQILQLVGINPHIIRLQDEGLKDKETDLNQYYGEILASNFEFYARHKLGLLPGEYSYLAGNSQDFVKDANYVDYANIHSQNLLFQKLDKWSDLLK